jgi:trans-aconitate methyltransferase
MLHFILVAAFLLSADFQKEQFQRHGFFQRREAEEMLAQLRLRGDEKILDVGCGDGGITTLLSLRTPAGEVVGLDPCLKCDQLCDTPPFPNLRFVEAKAESFSLDEKFDLIVAIHTLHWVKEQRQALENFYNHLKPGGRVYFIIARSIADLPLGIALERTPLNGYARVFDAQEGQVYLDMGTYWTMMRNIGFQIDEMRLTYRDSLFPSGPEMGEWVKQWLPHYREMDEEHGEQFIDQLLANYLEELGLPANWWGEVPYGEYTLILEATR